MDAIQYADPAPCPAAGEEHCAAPQENLPGFGVLEDDSGKESETHALVDADDWVKEFEYEENPDGEDTTKKSGEKVHVPPSFFEREAFCVLEKEGLTALPSSETEGLGLSYHSQSQQWHARWKVRKLNFAPTWGQKRS